MFFSACPRGPGIRWMTNPSIIILISILKIAQRKIINLKWMKIRTYRIQQRPTRSTVKRSRTIWTFCFCFVFNLRKNRKIWKSQQKFWIRKRKVTALEEVSATRVGRRVTCTVPQRLLLYNRNGQYPDTHALAVSFSLLWCWTSSQQLARTNRTII